MKRMKFDISSLSKLPSHSIICSRCVRKAANIWWRRRTSGLVAQVAHVSSGAWEVARRLPLIVQWIRHIIVMMSAEEDNALMKLNHMIHDTWWLARHCYWANVFPSLHRRVTWWFTLQPAGICLGVHPPFHI
jgi:hypothetical protein